MFENRRCCGSPSLRLSQPVRIVRNIRPIRVHCVNQVELPFPGKFLDALFALDRVNQKIILLKPNQRFHAIPGCKSGRQVVLMFENPAGQVPGDAGINRSVALGCENVDVTLPACIMANCSNFSRYPRTPHYRPCGGNPAARRLRCLKIPLTRRTSRGWITGTSPVMRGKLG